MTKKTTNEIYCFGNLHKQNKLRVNQHPISSYHLGYTQYIKIIAQSWKRNDGADKRSDCDYKTS